VQVFQGHALGTDIACAEYVSLVAANAADFAIGDLDFQSAAGFTQGADAIVNGVGHVESRVVRGGKRMVMPQVG
jgi:hypothetical protein